MDELNEIWDELLAEAASAANIGGGFAEFVAVKSANDRIRESGIEQLLAAFQKIAAHVNRQNGQIVVESVDNHRFAFEAATAVGRLAKYRHGVRCLTIEAGWTRTPSDGFMRGNALAVARISHFGIPEAGSDLKLLRLEDSVGWFRTDSEGLKISVELEDLILHFQTLLG
jgi:hypothetical protein